MYLRKGLLNKESSARLINQFAVISIQKKISRLSILLCVALGIMPVQVYAVKSIKINSLLSEAKPQEPWDRGAFMADKTVYFTQVNSSGTNANQIAMVTLTYFTSTNCSGTRTGTPGTYTTPNNGSSIPLPIALGVPFGLVASSTWNVGVNKAGIAIGSMPLVQSVAVTFYSTTNNVPQSDFFTTATNHKSFACVPVSCNSGSCTSTAGTQNFALKTTALAGDPAYGGVIGCMGGGLLNVILAPSGTLNTQWGPTNRNAGATSINNGLDNTTKIINCLSNGTGTNCTAGTNINVNTYPAGLCSLYAAPGAYAGSWFLPATNASATPANTGQLGCIYTNTVAINNGLTATGGTGLGNLAYWSSTEVSITNARYLFYNFGGGQGSLAKSNTGVTFRCTRDF